MFLYLIALLDTTTDMKSFNDKKNNSMANELFTPINRKVGDLLTDVKNGRIGLPDLQRPFVWKDNKVRELLDSMLKGYPIGFVMLWESPADFANKSRLATMTRIGRKHATSLLMVSNA